MSDLPSIKNSPKTNNVQTPAPKVGLVPTGVTVGLGVFAFILSIAGYGFRLLVEPFDVVFWHAIKLVPVFMIVVPALTCAFAVLINRFGDGNIAMKNAWTFGWLLSAVFMLSKMGVYS